MEPISLHVFDPVSGAHITGVPFTNLSWSETISDTGSMSVTLPDTDALRKIDLSRVLREYGSIWLAKSGSRVLHAGYLVKWQLNEKGGSVTCDIGGGWTLWRKRLVVNHALASKWRDGIVLIDEDNPPGDWVLTLSGTYRDIARGLVAESLKWGGAPYELPAVQGGSAHSRTYNAWDFSTVSDRLGDLADLEDGPEIRFDPRLDGNRMRFYLNVDSEIVDTEWRWNASLPGQRVKLSGIDADGSDITGQCFGTGGKDEDDLMVAMRRSSRLTGLGWPLLQSANTSHSTISVLATLQGYVAADVRAGDEPQLTVGVKCGIEHDVHVGDWIDLRLPAGGRDAPSGLAAHLLQRLYNSTTLQLKVTDVSGSAGSEWLDLQTRVRS